jgi:small conductance mechanosensitive channel
MIFAPAAVQLEQEVSLLWVKSIALLPMLAIGVVILGLSIGLSGPLSRLATRPVRYVTDSELIRIVMRRIVSVFIILIGLYFFLKLAGLTQIALAIISGTGVIGLIMGFAFKDIAENFMSSLLLSMQRPFQLGDVIAVQGFKGVVKKMTARGTTLIDFDGNYIQIPNATIYKNIIQNYTANPKLRGSFDLKITYASSVVKAQNCVIEILKNHHAVLNEPEPQVLIERFGDSKIELKVFFWIDGQQYDTKKVSSKMMQLIMERFDADGIALVAIGPDEVIFPQGIQVYMSHVEPLTGERLNTTYPTLASDDSKPNLAQTEVRAAPDNLGSETETIRQQANNSRDPETGNNIL